VLLLMINELYFLIRMSFTRARSATVSSISASIRFQYGQVKPEQHFLRAYFYNMVMKISMIIYAKNDLMNQQGCNCEIPDEAKRLDLTKLTTTRNV
jgi:hypothetical protein